MNGRRALSELLGDLADSAAAFVGRDGAMPVQARSMSIRLPIDLRLVETADGPAIIGDVPLFLTRTDFDPEPARLEVEWHAIRLDGQGTP